MSTLGRDLYLLTNWLAYLYERIQSPRPDVMPDRREGITKAAGFGLAKCNISNICNPLKFPLPNSLVSIHLIEFN